MQQDIARRIEILCDTVAARLRTIPDEEFSARPAPGKWSRKEILGHLIDSAANNHQRFVRGQFEESPAIFYDQNRWVSLQDYQNANAALLISLWESYNRYLAHVIKAMPDESLEKQCRGRDGSTATLDFLVRDYLRHLEHHLKQIVEY